MSQTRTLRFAIAVIVAATALAATKSPFKSTFKSPDAGPVKFVGKTVAAMVFTRGKDARPAAENALARELNARGAVGVAAYSLIPDDAVSNKDRVKELFQHAGVAGVVVMSVVGKNQQISGSPEGHWGAPSYATFWGDGYYGWSAPDARDPSYPVDRIAIVEVMVYSLVQDKLVWAGQSRTTNPPDVDRFVNRLVVDVVAELQKQGLIK